MELLMSCRVAYPVRPYGAASPVTQFAGRVRYLLVWYRVLKFSVCSVVLYSCFVFLCVDRWWHCGSLASFGIMQNKNVFNSKK